MGKAVVKGFDSKKHFMAYLEGYIYDNWTPYEKLSDDQK
jgi:hypothetical protein